MQMKMTRLNAVVCLALSSAASEAEKLARLKTIRTWKNPAPDSFYDDIGNIAKMPYVERAQAFNVDPRRTKAAKKPHSESLFATLNQHLRVVRRCREQRF